MGDKMKSIKLPIILVSLSFGVMSFLLPIYSKAMNMSAVEIGGVFSVFSVALLVMKPLMGRWADKVGYKPLLFLGMILYAVSFYGFANMKGVASLYLARIIQGVAASLVGISTYGIAISGTSENNTAEQLGGVTAASTKGVLIGSILSFWVLWGVEFIEGWNRLFTLYTIAAVVASLMVMKKMPNIKVGTATKKSITGRLSSGVIKLLIIDFLTAFASSMLAPILMIYLQDHFTNQFELLALIFMPSIIICSVLPAYMGRMSDRLGRVRGMILGLLLSGVVAIMIPSVNSLVVLAILWGINSVGGLLEGPSEKVFYYELVGEDGLGEMYGIYSAVGSLGAIIGPLVGGLVYDMIADKMVFYLQGILLIIAVSLVGIFFRTYRWGLDE